MKKTKTIKGAYNIKHGFLLGHKEDMSKVDKSFYFRWVSFNARHKDLANNKHKDFKSFYDDLYVPYLQHIKDHGDKNTVLSSTLQWVTYAEHSNKRKNTVKVTYQGQAYSIKQIAEKFNINDISFRAKLRKGISVSDIINNVPCVRKVHAVTTKYFIIYKDSIDSISRLSDIQRRVLSCLYGGKRAKTLNEAGIKFNLTRERIRQIRNKAFKILSK